MLGLQTTQGLFLIQHELLFIEVRGRLIVVAFLVVPSGSEGKASACNAGDPGSIPGLGRFPWRRKWQPTPVFMPGKSHGWRSPVGYSSWGRKEAETTERHHFLLLWSTRL